jgi:chromosome segregation ATPase
MSNNNNGNGNHSNLDFETANSTESSDLGEVKIALGRLYREFENFKQSQKTERERDRAELQAWAQTNLIQNQLLSKAMVTIEMLTGELKNQNLSSNEYEQSNENLRQELTPLLTQLKNTPKSRATLESLEFKGLKSEITELKQNWNQLLNHTQKLTTVIQELKNSPLVILPPA